MKKIFLTASLALGLTSAMQAQDTYLNERLVNTSSELNGTARYVGMGGAMGALGADMSTMSYNPAGIGLYRRSDISFTAGAQWNASGVDGIRNTRGTFDQLGFVWSTRTDSDKMTHFNFGFNYQKKINYGQGFVADNLNLKGLSQMDQMAELVNEGYGTTYNLPGAAEYFGFLTPSLSDNGNPIEVNGQKQYFNKYNGEQAFYTHNQWGGLNAFDVNLSGNVNDRVYWGVTLGFESLKYRAEGDYFEKSSIKEDGILKIGDYSLYNNYAIDGSGFNLKLGLIARPFEESAFRVGLAMETPSWYQLTSSTLFQLYDEVDGVGYSRVKGQMDESYLEYSLRNPIKGRFSMGSSVGNFLLWDVDYEIANYGRTAMGYPRNDSYDGSTSLFNNQPDNAMNKLSKRTLGLQHTVRAGIEVKPTSSVAVRAGYNYSSSPYKTEKPSFDQYSLDSYAMDYMTHTNYMKVGDTHTVTLGLGYKYKSFYADLAYKYRNQQADFYHFDDTFNQEDPIITENGQPGGKPVSLSPVQANLSRHQITCTLGFKL